MIYNVVKTINVGNIIIMDEDLKNPYSKESYWRKIYNDEPEIVHEGWRLPTIEETLYFYHLHKIMIGNFKYDLADYLSSTALGNDKVITRNIQDGKIWATNTDTPCWVRLVKSI